MEALYDAADDDTATGGPDLTRKIYPVVMTATADSTHRLTEAEINAVAEQWSPDGWRTRAADSAPGADARTRADAPARDERE